MADPLTQAPTSIADASATKPPGGRPLAAGLAGAVVGTLGGLIGLGGAEFRLPLLITLFRFDAIRAVIVNKAMSLIVVAASLPFRASTIPLSEVGAHWPIIANLLAGSLAGAWIGAGWATRLSSPALYRVISIMLVIIAAVLMLGHGITSHGALLTGSAQLVVGVLAGFVIGIVAAVLGVAGGELLIPTLVLLFGADIKLAGSLSLAVSLPTMLIGFARYSQDKSFSVLADHRTFVIVMAIGSIAGAFIGSKFLEIIPSTVLIPILVLMLLISAIKIWRH